MSQNLSWCNKCKENSCLVKCYTRKDGERKRIEICLNKGCGYKRILAPAVVIMSILLLLSFKAWADTPIQDQVIKTAIQEIGNGERGKNNYGQAIKKYCGREGVSWCAGFISYILKENGVKAFGYTLSARSIYNKGIKQGLGVKEARAGDLICFWRVKKNSWQGHIGIIERVTEDKIITIEGNKGKYPAKVKRVTYNKGNVPQLLGYIRYY